MHYHIDYMNLFRYNYAASIVDKAYVPVKFYLRFFPYRNF
jgi:hypothetical protein